MPASITSEAARKVAAARWSKAPVGEETINRIVKAAPRLTEEQKAILRALLDTPAEVTE